MISAILYDSGKRELNKIKELVSDAVSLLTDDELRLSCYQEEAELAGSIGEIDLCDFIIAEFEGQGQAIDRIRKRFPAVPLLLVVDVTVSPLQYIRPGVMPSALILRPLEEKDMKKNITDFLAASMTVREKDEESTLRVETRSGIIKVPISKVIYFETKAKKVYIRLRNEEYGYYDTLEHLETELPENFLRCHRGVIVNMDYVKRYSPSDKLLYLEYDMEIPVSRSYNAAVRGRMK
jgi:DNA-binding LytR/AlgR family response regulator